MLPDKEVFSNLAQATTVGLSVVIVLGTHPHIVLHTRQPDH